MATAHNTTPISIAFPELSDLHLKFAVGACRFRAASGEAEAWLSGNYEDPSGSLPVKITQEGGTVLVSQEPSWADILGWLSGVPRFDLALGKSRPYALTMESGASEIWLDLGGVPVSRLVAKHGAGRMELDFSSPNPEQMNLLNLGSGAGDVSVRHLANANCAEMVIEGGAAAYRFDFGGELKRNAHVRVQTGVSSVEITVPASTAAKITPESVLGGMDVSDGLTKREGAFWTPGAVAGNTPVLTIHTSVALGSLKLRLT